MVNVEDGSGKYIFAKILQSTIIVLKLFRRLSHRVHNDTHWNDGKPNLRTVIFIARIEKAPPLQ